MYFYSMLCFIYFSRQSKHPSVQQSSGQQVEDELQIVLDY